MSKGRIYKQTQSRNWWIAYHVCGKEYRESSRSTDRKVAEVMLQQRLREKATDSIGVRTFSGLRHERVTLAELLDGLEHDYRIQGHKSADHLHDRLRGVRRRLQGLRALDLNAARIRAYIRRRLDQGTANATIDRELGGLRSLQRHLDGIRVKGGVARKSGG